MLQHIARRFPGMNREQRHHLRHHALHGVSPDQVDSRLDTLLPVHTEDTLRQLGTERFDIVATNPPFGRKSSIRVIGEEGDVGSEAISDERDDFWATTSNKQLNVLQDIRSLLKINGRSVVLLPDNVLFFERRSGSARAATQRLWVYDLRTNLPFTLKTRPLQRADLDEFVALYKPGAIAERQPTWSEANPEGRWRCFELEELLALDKINLDLFWLKDDSQLDSESLSDPDLIATEIAAEITGDLRSALEPMETILADLEPAGLEPAEAV